MGYFMRMTSGSFVIPYDLLEIAYRRMCALNDYPTLKQYGEAFKWMPENYPDKFNSTEEILNALGFETDRNAAGDLIILHFDNKLGDQDIFVASVSDLIPEGSEIYWTGEDDERWVWHISEGVMYETEILPVRGSSKAYVAPLVMARNIPVRKENT